MMMNPVFDNVIRQTLNYNYAEHSGEASFNISYGIDKNFLFGCGVSIASILISNPGKSFTFHIFTDYLDEDERRRFETCASEYATQIIIYLIDCEQLKSLPSTRNWSYATYFRFIIADYFVGRADKVLYLDADIACKGSIQELIDFEFSGNTIAAVVLEGESEWWVQRSIRLKTPGLVNGYFNAGFLLMNISVWFADNISGRAIEMLSDPEVAQRITHLDQDVLNVLLVNRTHIVDVKFNTRFSLNYELKDKFVNPVNDNTVFIHYIGPTKPWHNWGIYPVSTCFLNAKKHSPWRDVELEKPHNSHQLRYSAKHMLNQKKYFLGFYNYVLYFLSKIFK